MAGSATLIFVRPFLDLGAELGAVAAMMLGVSLVVDAMMILLGELGMPHASGDAARAAREIRKGRYAFTFWWGVLVAGHVTPMLLLSLSGVAWASLAGLLSLVGLYLFEHAFVMAPQEIPNS